MSEAFRSAVALRNDICQFASELALRYTAPLPNGAAVYVTGPDALYRLFKGLGNAFDNLGTAIVVPTNGSDDRWVQESSRGASPWAGTEVLLGALNTTPSAQFAWTALGSTAGSFQLSTGDSLMFAVNPTTGLMTYHGVTREMTIRYQASVLCGSAATIIAQAAISVNNDIPAGDTNEHRGAGNQASTVTDTSEQLISGERSVLLSDGATIRLMLRNMNGTQVITTDFYSLSVAPT